MYFFVQNKRNLEITKFENAKHMNQLYHDNNKDKNLYWFGHKVLNKQMKEPIDGMYGQKNEYRTFQRALKNILGKNLQNGCMIGWENCCHYLKIDGYLKCGPSKKIRQNSKHIRSFMRRNHLEHLQCFYTSDNQPPQNDITNIYDTYELLQNNHPNLDCIELIITGDHVISNCFKYYILNKLHHLSIHKKLDPIHEFDFVNDLMQPHSTHKQVTQ